MTGVSEAERLARVLLSRVGEPGDPRLTDLVHELSAADRGGQPAPAGGRPRAGRGPRRAGHHDRSGRGSSSAPPGSASGSSCRVTRSGPLPSTTSRWHRTCTSAAVCRSVSGAVDRCGSTRRPSRAVAVVGSRSATTYGADVAGDIAATLARETWTVVSGAAFGIDQAAHRGALANRGPTVAVLACGADRAYPSAHRNLIDYVADVGLVVSEAPPGCAPTRIRFLARNRLIAALSRGVVVVEAAVRSGALNTASWAGGLGRTGDGSAGAGHERAVRRRAPADPGPGCLARDLGGGGARGRGSDGQLHAGRAAGGRTSTRPTGATRAPGARRRAARRGPPTPPRSPASAGVAHGRTKDALLALLRAGLVEHSLGRWRLVTDSDSP